MLAAVRVLPDGLSASGSSASKRAQHTFSHHHYGTFSMSQPP